MQYRELGRTGWKVSTIGFGAWAIGGSWGPVDDAASMAALHHALDRGVNFFDTADVYGDGHSERLIARLRRERGEPFQVERSLRNLEVEAIDLLQLHCPPTEVFYMPEVFGFLDDLVAAGKLRHYGVSVQKVEEALKAIEFPGVQSVQIVYNVLRQRPAELFFREARRRGVGILARLPLSSGLLSGRLTRQSTFAADDHRSFNREGAAFDKGETFSGLDFDIGLEVVEALRPLVRPGETLSQFALRWILMDEAVTCAIPGGRHAAQVEENTAAADLPPLSPQVLRAIAELYDRRVRPHVHQLW